MRQAQWKILLAMCLAAASVTLAACGGDDDDTGADEQEITEAITASATGTDPSACTELQTRRFVEQTSEGTGQEAVQECRENAEEAVAEEAEVSDIEIDGGSATAETSFTGGFLDGQTVEIALVEEDGQWKLDELVGFADLDRQAFIENIRTGFTEDEEEAPQEVVDCVVGNLEGLSDEEYEDLFLNNDRQLEGQVFDSCFEGG